MKLMLQIINVIQISGALFRVSAFGFALFHITVPD